MRNDEMPDLPDLGIYCCSMASIEESGGELACRCGQSEAVLRAYIDGARVTPMTQPQRDWCYAQIESVECTDCQDLESCSDVDLSRRVLSAWSDYCKDKGLL